MSRTVHCVKLQKELPGLEKPPFSGELGQRIYDNVSADAYAEWKPQLTTIINHYGLNPADPETRQVLRQQMEAFFFAEQALATEDLNPETVKTS